MKSNLITLSVQEEQQLKDLETRSTPSRVTQLEIMDLLIEITQEVYTLTPKTTQKPVLVSFEDPDVGSDDLYRTLTGLGKQDFDSLLQDIRLRSSKSWNKRNSLGLYLFRLRTGLSLGILSALFGCKSRREVSQRIKRTRKQILRSKLMLEHFGFGQMTRHDLIHKHTTQFAKTFFGRDENGDITRPVVIIDGSYNSLETDSDSIILHFRHLLIHRKEFCRSFVSKMDIY